MTSIIILPSESLSRSFALGLSADIRLLTKGILLTELIEEIDTKLTYGGARKISEFEAELLDQIDESYDAQIKMQRDLDYAKKETKRAQESLKKTDDAISEYCSETTKNKILLV